MRALVGLLLLAAVALGGFERATSSSSLQGWSLGRVTGQQTTATASLAAGSAPIRPAGGVFHTVAAADPNLPLVQAAPDAPKAAPIDPIVAPIKKAVPITPSPAASTPAKGKAAPAKAQTDKAKTGSVSTRPGFKLTCTSTQKLDTAKKKCVPIKGTTVASVKRA